MCRRDKKRPTVHLDGSSTLSRSAMFFPDSARRLIGARTIRTYVGVAKTAVFRRRFMNLKALLKNKGRSDGWPCLRPVRPSVRPFVGAYITYATRLFRVRNEILLGNPSGGRKTERGEGAGGRKGWTLKLLSFHFAVGRPGARRNPARGRVHRAAAGRRQNERTRQLNYARPPFRHVDLILRQPDVGLMRFSPRPAPLVFVLPHNTSVPSSTRSSFYRPVPGRPHSAPLCAQPTHDDRLGECTRPTHTLLLTGEFLRDKLYNPKPNVFMFLLRFHSKKN